MAQQRKRRSTSTSRRKPFKKSPGLSAEDKARAQAARRQLAFQVRKEKEEQKRVADKWGAGIDPRHKPNRRGRRKFLKRQPTPQSQVTAHAHLVFTEDEIPKPARIAGLHRIAGPPLFRYTWRYKGGDALILVEEILKRLAIREVEYGLEVRGQAIITGAFSTRYLHLNQLRNLYEDYLKRYQKRIPSEPDVWLHITTHSSIPGLQ